MKKSRLGAVGGVEINADQLAVRTLAASLPLSDAQRQEVERHDLPLFAQAPARALWGTTLGGTTTYLYNTIGARTALNYHQHPDHGAGIFYLIEHGTATRLSPEEALGAHATLPRLFRLSPHRDAPAALLLDCPEHPDLTPQIFWPDSPDAEEARELHDQLTQGQGARYAVQMACARLYQRRAREVTPPVPGVHQRSLC